MNVVEVHPSKKLSALARAVRTGRPRSQQETYMNLYDRIPNNVNLSEDKRLQRALEKWLPNFLGWWLYMGPDGFQDKDVWLRTAVDVGSEGWPPFAYVKMPDYRSGFFLAPAQPDAKVGLGVTIGAPAYQEVPGEF